MDAVCICSISHMFTIHNVSAGHKVKQLQGEVTLPGGGGGHRETRDQVSSHLFSSSLLCWHCFMLASPGCMFFCLFCFYRFFFFFFRSSEFSSLLHCCFVSLIFGCNGWICVCFVLFFSLLHYCIVIVSSLSLLAGCMFVFVLFIMFPFF